MNERLQELLDAVQRTASQVGGSAADAAYGMGKRAGELLSVAKLNIRIMDLKGAVSTALREVGEMIYATHTGTLTESEVLLADRSAPGRRGVPLLRGGRPERRRILPGMRPKAVRRKRKMEYTFAQYQESAQALRDRLGAFRPRCLLILGSGLGSLGNEVESPIAVPYEDVPHMKRSTAPDHAGRFVFGRLAGQDVAVMQGRLHTYEGWSFEDVSYPVRVLRLLGAETLVVTNAAGAVNTAFSAGDIMLITDHIKLFGVSPLCGPNLEEFGPRFPDMSHVYTPRLQDTAREAAEELSIPLRQGVYMYFPGPQYETPAEVRAARVLGADAVGMSTVPEAIVAAHCGMDVLGFTLCTNMGAGVLDQPLSSDEVLAAAATAGPQFSALVKACLARL